MTQDLSFSSTRDGDPTSINGRIDISAYTEMVFGWCLPRILHFIVAIQIKFPILLILIAKYDEDYSNAHRRIAHSASAAAQTIAVHAGLAYLSLRLKFGDRPPPPPPPTWCLFSEFVTDLANEIGNCQEWDPKLLHSPAQPTLPSSRRLPGNIPIAPGQTVEFYLKWSRWLCMLQVAPTQETTKSSFRDVLFSRLPNWQPRGARQKSRTCSDGRSIPGASRSRYGTTSS